MCSISKISVIMNSCLAFHHLLNNSKQKTGFCCKTNFPSEIELSTSLRKHKPHWKGLIAKTTNLFKTIPKHKKTTCWLIKLKRNTTTMQLTPSFDSHSLQTIEHRSLIWIIVILSSSPQKALDQCLICLLFCLFSSWLFFDFSFSFLLFSLYFNLFYGLVWWVDNIDNALSFCGIWMFFGWLCLLSFCILLLNLFDLFDLWFRFCIFLVLVLLIIWKNLKEISLLRLRLLHSISLIIFWLFSFLLLHNNRTIYININININILVILILIIIIIIYNLVNYRTTISIIYLILLTRYIFAICTISNTIMPNYDYITIFIIIVCSVILNLFLDQLLIFCTKDIKLLLLWLFLKELV